MSPPAKLQSHRFNQNFLCIDSQDYLTYFLHNNVYKGLLKQVKTFYAIILIQSYHQPKYSIGLHFTLSSLMLTLYSLESLGLLGL